MRLIGLICAIAAAWYFGLFSWFKSYTYRAEVGFYKDDSRTWFVGEDKSYDACIAEAQEQYLALNAKHPNRAFSWACRKMQGEEFLERVR